MLACARVTRLAGQLAPEVKLAAHTDDVIHSLVEGSRVHRVVTLNREKKLNALSMDGMLRFSSLVSPASPTAAATGVLVVRGAGSRAFCAGGDISEIVGDATGAYNSAWFSQEYRMNRDIHQRGRQVSMWRGVVMGGGVGVSLYGSHRVATPTSLFAMPECGIGFFPDIGASFFLPRLLDQRAPGLALYLACTGRRLGAADLLKFGFATHFAADADACEGSLLQSLGSGELAARADVSTAEIDALLLAAGAVPAGPSGAIGSVAHDSPEAVPADVDTSKAMTDPEILLAREAFSPGSLAHVVKALDATSKAGSELAGKTLKKVRAQCPLTLRITERQFALGARAASLEACLEMEWSVAKNMTVIGDNANMKEGVTKVLGKSKEAVQWQPATLEEVTEADVDRFFRETDRLF